MFELTGKWATFLVDVVIDSGHITRIGYSLDIPFVEADIEKIVVTHGTKFRRGFWNRPILQDREK